MDTRQAKPSCHQVGQIRVSTAFLLSPHTEGFEVALLNAWLSPFPAWSSLRNHRDRQALLGAKVTFELWLWS